MKLMIYALFWKVIDVNRDSDKGEHAVPWHITIIKIPVSWDFLIYYDELNAGFVVLNLERLRGGSLIIELTLGTWFGTS